MGDALIRGALISDCGRYRYSLTRRWEEGHAPRIVFVMLNPSTADATQDDPTIRKCIAFAQAWKYGSLEVVNLFAWRATDPRELLTAPDPVGPDNDTAISSAARYSRACVFAHGTSGSVMLTRRIASRHWTVRALVEQHGHDVKCLGHTKGGFPKHPLYLRADTSLVAITERQ